MVRRGHKRKTYLGLDCIFWKPNLSILGTYHVQTVQTPIWTTESTSKGGAVGVGGPGDVQSVITQSKSEQLIVKLLNPPCSLDIASVA